MLQKWSRGEKIALASFIVAVLALLLDYFTPYGIIGPPPTATPSNLSQSPTSNPVIAADQTLEPSPTLFPTHVVVPSFISDYVTIEFTGTRSISLSAGELIVGDADRFQGATGEPPCTAFLIKGPYKGELLIYWGGWDQWENVYDDAFAEQLLAVKIEKFKTHPTCPSRGPINVVRLP